MYYFGIQKRLERQVLKHNNLAIGKFREPFFTNHKVGMVLVIVVAAVIGLAIAGKLLTQ